MAAPLSSDPNDPNDPNQQVRKRVMQQLGSTASPDPSADVAGTSVSPAASTVTAPFVAPSPDAGPPPGPPPTPGPPGMTFNGTAYVGGGLSGVVPQYGTYNPTAPDPAITPGPPPTQVPPGVVPPNPQPPEPPPPGVVPPNPQPPEPPVPPDPIQIDPVGTAAPNPQGPSLAGNGALRSAVMTRLNPQPGHHRIFPNGKIGRWDGTGWEHIGGR